MVESGCSSLLKKKAKIYTALNKEEAINAICDYRLKFIVNGLYLQSIIVLAVSVVIVVLTNYYLRKLQEIILFR